MIIYYHFETSTIYHSVRDDTIKSSLELSLLGGSECSEISNRDIQFECKLAISLKLQRFEYYQLLFPLLQLQIDKNQSRKKNHTKMVQNHPCLIGYMQMS